MGMTILKALHADTRSHMHVLIWGSSFLSWLFCTLESWCQLFLESGTDRKTNISIWCLFSSPSQARCSCNSRIDGVTCLTHFCHLSFPCFSTVASSSLHLSTAFTTSPRSTLDSQS